MPPTVLKQKTEEFFHQKLLRLERELIKASEAVKREMIVALAEHYEKGYAETRPEVMGRMRKYLGKDNVEICDICVFLCRWIDANNLNITEQWVRKNLPDRFKLIQMRRESQESAKQLSQIDDSVNWTDIAKKWDPILAQVENKEELAYIHTEVKDVGQDYYRKGKLPVSTPSIQKEKFLEMKGWQCKTARVIAEVVCKRLEMEHQTQLHKELDEDGYVDLIYKETDKRRIGGKDTIEALLIKIAAGMSLADGIKSEHYVHSRSQLAKYEENCESCKKDPKGCGKNPRGYDHCICHSMVKLPTTKGFKYDRDNDPDLVKYNQWLEESRSKATIQLCSFALRTYNNVRVDMESRQRIIEGHIQEHGCPLCKEYVEMHPGMWTK